MSSENQSIVCRRCDEIISADVDNCPHCGKSTQGRGPWIAIVIGVIMVVPSLFEIATLWFFGLIGLALIAIGGWMIRDKRERIQEAEDRTQQGAEDAEAEPA